MNVTLNRDLQKRIRKQVQSGKYATAEEVVTAAILALEQQELLQDDFAQGELNGLLAAGERSIERSGTLDGDEAFRQRKKQRGRARKSAR